MNRGKRVVLTALVLALMPVAACADKGGHRRWQGENVSVPGQSVGADTASQGSSRRQSSMDTAVFRFTVEDRQRVDGYYRDVPTGKRCPPGLAKKGNGCQPPGLAKRWQIGRPIPPDVRSYALPAELVRRLPPPPPQHRYVRVGADVLLIAVGSTMVIDALEDIVR